MISRKMFREQAESAMIAACLDATTYGVGWVRILSDGTIENVDCKRVVLSDEEPTKEQS